MIQTVLGDISPPDLGICLPHEHIWCDQRLAPRRYLFDVTRSTATYMRLDHYENMVGELAAFREAGGGAIVEVTCEGWGRDLETLARLSAASGVHILATAGYYIEPCIPLYVDELSPEALADYITREVEVGVGKSGRRCGVLKSAINRARIEGLEEKVLCAVAKAQKRTGAAITTHTTGTRRQEIAGGNISIQQWKYLKSEGVPGDRFIAGHTDERPDVDALAVLMQDGCYVQFDVIGKEHWMLDQTRAEILHALIERGHVERLLISHDRNRGHEMRFGGGSGYNYIFETFLPRLRKLGVSDEQIKTIMVQNPARVFNRA